jgi:hypothetical protein
MEPHQLNRISFLIIQSAIQVHRALGPGLLPVHHAQLLSYLRLTGKPLGLLINFNVPVLVDGVIRKMNGCPEAALDTQKQN